MDGDGEVGEADPDLLRPGGQVKAAGVLVKQFGKIWEQMEADVVGSDSEVVGIGVCENDEAKLTGDESVSVGDGMAADRKELARGTETALAGCVAGRRPT